MSDVATATTAGLLLSAAAGRAACAVTPDGAEDVAVPVDTGVEATSGVLAACVGSDRGTAPLELSGTRECGKVALNDRGCCMAALAPVPCTAPHVPIPIAFLSRERWVKTRKDEQNLQNKNGRQMKGVKARHTRTLTKTENATWPCKK